MFEFPAEDQKRMTVFLRDLIRTPSFSCQEGQVAGRIADEMRAVGFQDVAMDRIGNVVGRIRCGAGPTLMFGGSTTRSEPRSKMASCTAWVRVT